MSTNEPDSPVVDAMDAGFALLAFFVLFPISVVIWNMILG